jgi:hypothetical protein
VRPHHLSIRQSVYVIEHVAGRAMGKVHGRRERDDIRELRAPIDTWCYPSNAGHSQLPFLNGSEIPVRGR